MRRQEWERHQRDEQLKRMEQARQQAFQESHDELVAIVEAWRRATAIEAFFEDATNRASALPENEQVAVRDRLVAARMMLGGTDALARFRGWRTADERVTLGKAQTTS